MGKKRKVLITDGDDCLWKAPVEGYLFPRAIIAKYLFLPEFGYLKRPPTHPWVKKVFDYVAPEHDSKIYKWLKERKETGAGRDISPRDVFERMLEDGTIGSRNDLMEAEGVYDLFVKMVENAPMNSLYKDYLVERGKQVKEILELFDEVWLYTAAKRKRVELALMYMDVTNYFSKIITEEDKMPKSKIKTFREIVEDHGNLVLFVDDSVAYVRNAQEAGLRAFHTSEYCSSTVEVLCKDNKLRCIGSFSDLRTFTDMDYPQDTLKKKKKTPWYKRRPWKRRKKREKEKENELAEDS